LLPENRRRQAESLGRWLMQPAAMAECGLVAPDDPALKAKSATVTRPSIDALEVTSYASPNGEMHFHTVAVVTQRCSVARRGKKPGVSFQCGGTLVFDAEGQLQMAVTKSALGEGRIERRQDFLAAAAKVERNRTTASAPARWIEHHGMLQLRRAWLRQYQREQRRTTPPSPQGPDDKG
jgi:hypothetical protein